MPELSVVIVASDPDQRSVLQVLVDGTSVARAVFSASSYPVAAADPIIRRIQSANPDVCWWTFPPIIPRWPAYHRTTGSGGSRCGDVRRGQHVTPAGHRQAMRAGAKEFIEKPTTTTDLLEAFVRLTTTQRKSQAGTSSRQDIHCGQCQGRQWSDHHRGKSGIWRCRRPTGRGPGRYRTSGSYRVAHESQAAVHRSDAVRNLHRLDSSLLESYMTRHERRLAVAGRAQIRDWRNLLTRSLPAVRHAGRAISATSWSTLRLGWIRRRGWWEICRRRSYW